MNSKANFSILFLCFITFTLTAQHTKVAVWPNGVPDAILNNEYIETSTFDELDTLKGLSKVSNPDISIFLADSTSLNAPSVIILPGGGYSHLAINKEGYKVAHWLNSVGISAFVLKYRMPTDKTMKNKTVGPLQDAQEAIRIVRRNAKKWNLNPNKIGVLGFSAGGHLASTLSTHYDDKVYTPSDKTTARPDFSILIYPVISMNEGITHNGSKNNLLGKKPSVALIEKYSNEKQIDTQTPPTFLVHATDDTVVPVENSINYYLSLKNNKIPAEMHIYENGGHGFGLGIDETNINWPEACTKWMFNKL